MALIERLGEQFPPVDFDHRINPYALKLDSPEVLNATLNLVNSEQPLIDDSTNPEIASDGKNYSVYFLSSDHPASVVSRAIEGAIFPEWEYDADQTEAEAAHYESNSSFFLVVDVTDPQTPKPAVSLRVADCLKGESATMEYFNEINIQNQATPVELQISDEDKVKQLWDIVGVMAPNEYRNSTVSVWAYHALYKKSLQMGVGRWISSIVDKEYKNLVSIGIPFREIEGVPKATLELPSSSRKLGFGFYTANVDEIHEEVSTQIAMLESSEKDVDISRYIAKLARLALNGTTKSIDSSIIAA